VPNRRKYETSQVNNPVLIISLCRMSMSLPSFTMKTRCPSSKLIQEVVYLFLSFLLSPSFLIQRRICVCGAASHASWQVYRIISLRVYFRLTRNNEGSTKSLFYAYRVIHAAFLEDCIFYGYYHSSLFTWGEISDMPSVIIFNPHVLILILGYYITLVVFGLNGWISIIESKMCSVGMKVDELNICYIWNEAARFERKKTWAPHAFTFISNCDKMEWMWKVYETQYIFISIVKIAPLTQVV